MKLISRRHWMAASSWLALNSRTRLQGGLRVLRQTPQVSVQDFAQYPAVLTPTSDFFVRDHFAPPQIDANAWIIRIEGAVKRSRAISLAELQARDAVSLVSVLECAGNGVGVGAVGCAAWRGPSLGALLEQCGVHSDARWVRLTGADSGKEPDSGPADIRFSRVVALSDAMQPHALLATTMNDAPLLPEHGSPVRFILGGSYGMNAVKRLTNIELLTSKPDSFFNDRRFRRVPLGIPGAQVNEMAVKSIIVRPRAGGSARQSEIAAGGYAWAGVDAIARVEVSLDERKWRPARLLGKTAPFLWTPWRFDFETTQQPGTHTIAVRAYSSSGREQPPKRDPEREDEYELNYYHRVRYSIP